MNTPVASRHSGHNSTRKLVVTAMLVALVLILVFSGLGFIPFLVFAITLYHIPVIIAAQAEGWTTGLIVAFMFGATSLYKALTAPAGLYDPLFVNPLVSILPRLLIVPATLLGLRLLRGRGKLAYAVSALLGTLANTIFTLSAISIALLVSPGTVGLTAGPAVKLAIGAIWGGSMVNAALECVLAMAVCTGVMTALEKTFYRDRHAQ